MWRHQTIKNDETCCDRSRTLRVCPIHALLNFIHWKPMERHINAVRVLHLHNQLWTLASQQPPNWVKSGQDTRFCAALQQQCKWTTAVTLLKHLKGFHVFKKKLYIALDINEPCEYSSLEYLYFFTRAVILLTWSGFNYDFSHDQDQNQNRQR